MRILSPIIKNVQSHNIHLYFLGGGGGGEGGGQGLSALAGTRMSSDRKQNFGS